MAVRLFAEPELRQPDMVVGWPGVGNVGVVAVDTLRQSLEADELGEIEPWDFFYPNKVTIRNGVLRDMAFPSNKFYYKRLPERDLVLFLAEEQPSGSGRVYSEGSEAHEMTKMVLDVAEKFGCRRIFTSGAAVALIHHDSPSRVWAFASDRDALDEACRQPNTVLMSEVEGYGDIGSMPGLNGLLIGAAGKRGFPGTCLRGEIPDYLSRVPFPYPPASRAVLEVLGGMLGIEIDYRPLDEMQQQMESVVANVFQQFPASVRERIEQRRKALDVPRGEITADDERWLKDHIDDLFRQGEEGR